MFLRQISRRKTFILQKHVLENLIGNWKIFLGIPFFYLFFFLKCKTEIKCSDWNAHIFLLFLITLTPSSYTVAPAVNEPSIMFYWLSFNKASIYCLIKKHRCTTGVQALVWARSHENLIFQRDNFQALLHPNI